MSDTPERKDAAYALAKCVVDTEFVDLPAGAVDIARKSIMDTLGVIIGASGTNMSVRALVDLVKDGGGKPESSILGFGGKVPAWMAAFANGAMAHSLDYDDLQHEAVYHPSSAVVPAAFAIAQRVRPVGGKEFITAVVLAQDMGIRLAMAVAHNRRPLWQRSAVIGTFTSAAAAARLLGLNVEKTSGSLGMALCQCAGTMEARYGVGSDIGGMYPGFAAKGGVLSALLAQKGVSGASTCLEGRAGLFNVYFDGQYERGPLVADLGRKFAGTTIGFKPWPACGASHNYIDATLSAMKENGIRPDNIDRISVYVGDIAQRLCEPLAARQRPASVLDAKFSIPFCVALAAVKGNIVIGDFTAAAIKDAKVLEMAQKVKPVADATRNISDRMPAGAVEIATNRGGVFRKEVATPLGHPDRPLSFQGIESKFRDCLGYAPRAVLRANVDRVIELIKNIETTNDVAEIIDLLTEE